MLKIAIIDDRHPVVEKVIDGEYVPNDIMMDENTNMAKPVWILNEEVSKTAE